MGIIQVNTPEGLVDVKISGTDPTPQEQQRIIDRFFPQSPQAGGSVAMPTIQEVAAQFGQKEDPDFDYQTGADSGLRALLSFGESAEDKEAILTKLVGSDGFTRDSSGKLALTPKGQIAREMEAQDRNLIIEDEGFSFGDVADLAGILPETVGSVAGAITTFPFMFGAPGAAAGAAIGQLLEEGIESSLGVQKQSAREVAKDVAREAALAGTFELAGGLVFKAAGALLGGAGKVARGVNQPLATTQLDDISRLERLAEKKAIGSAEAAGAPGLIAYKQKFGENVLKDHNRVQNNLNIMLSDADNLRATYGAMANEIDAPEVFSNVVGKKYKSLKNAEQKASQAATKALRESIDIIEKSSVEGLDINRELLQRISDEFGSSMLMAQNKFNTVDELLNSVNLPGLGTGRTAEIIPTQSIKSKIDSIEEALGGKIDTFGENTGRAAEYIRGLPENASFRQIAEARKMMNDALFREASSQAKRDFADEFYALRSMLDEATTGRELSEIASMKMTPKQRQVFEEASRQRKDAIDFYRETMKSWEDVEQFGVVRDLRQMMSRDGKFDVDQLTNRIVRPDSPERLKTIYTALGDGAEPFRAALARDYLEKAMMKTGVSEFGDFTKGTFSGRAFAGQINKLGTTGKELFGESWDEVKRLSEALEMAGPDKLNRDAVAKIIATNSEAAPVDVLRQLVEAKEAVAKVDAIKTIDSFNKGTLTPEDAIKRITSKGSSRSEVEKIVKFFENDDDALRALKGALVDDILSTVDSSLFDSVQNAEQLLKTINQYKANNNVLEKVLGEEGAEALEEFAKDIKILGDVSKEGSVAAPAYTANPIKKYKDLIQFKILNQIGRNPEVYKATLKRTRGRLEGTAEAANDRVVQQVENAANKVLTGARITSTGIRQGVLVPSVSSAMTVNRDRPTMQTPQLTEPNKSSSLSSASPVAPGPEQFYGIPQQASQPSIRQQAATNPGIAQALGIRGATAGLLK